MSIKDRILKNLADFNFFQIIVIADMVHEGITYKNRGQTNNESIITPENWKKYKVTFFQQRMEKYKDSYSLQQKINLELELIKKLPLQNNDYKVLADNYSIFLCSQNTSTHKQQKKTSYVWQNNPDKELPELHSLMIDTYKLIASETTIEQFTAIFKGQPIESIEPIKWHQENASELLYFIGRLEQSDNIVHNPKKADYLKMTACFVKPDGQKFKANWKQIKQNISINLSSDKQKAIDELLKNF
jgi:hypothetical protein